MRLDVGSQSIGVAETAMHKALTYVQERRQGARDTNGKPLLLVQHPDVRRQILSMRVSCDGIRALLYTGAFHEDLVQGGMGKLSEESRRESRDLVEWLLPLIKAGGSEAGDRIAYQAIQLHGGHGYIADHAVEQLARDGRINAIYEGTNAIQASVA